MMSGNMLRLVLLVCLASFLPARGELYNHLMTTPQSPKLEIGTNFTATCTITNTTEITADDLFWNLSQTTVPKEQYIKINRSALNVTILITSETPKWLFCLCKKKSFYVQMNRGKFQHGIALKKGYRPEKPENLSCEAVQEKKSISPTISCKWDAAERQTHDFPITYTLNVQETSGGEASNASTNTKSAKVTKNIFPHHMSLDIWVESLNELGRAESEHLVHDANYFVKTNPPLDVRVISENGFPSSLLVNWTHPIDNLAVKLIYQIRFCPLGSHSWTDVPFGDIATDIQSFRLQKLDPYTIYVIQVRCKYFKAGQGHWSNWSTNVTKRTPEDRPSSKPDLWKTITEDGINERQVQIVCKDPVSANGRILSFDVRIQNQKEKVKNGSEWESISTNRSEVDSRSHQREITRLKTIRLDKEQSLRVYVAAINSVGRSPEASMGIPAKALELGSVQNLRVWPHEGQLLTEWKPPNSTDVTEYVVEWVSGGLMDWQREPRSTRHTAIKGDLQPFVRYTVSVYPIYSGWIGKPARADAFVAQKVPSQAPDVSVDNKTGRNEVTLKWEEIPEHKKNGFITHYTLFYGDGAVVRAITLPGDRTSYTLKSLSANTKYEVWIQASTVEGSKNGSKSYFTTLKYAPGEIEGIVAGVSLGFLFVALMTMLLCFYKKNVIKEKLWPQIPNPGESTIGSWSPDYPLKEETPKENCLSGISVLDVDTCDTKCGFEEDKASLALKKDKYLSEEHSSGIGGSSCMSSPRQSVSDSDEGGDMADTTASTVQYSSVVASSGYKGQTPSTQPQQSVFSRSESTQPLLDSEENPDMLVQEGSRQFQRYPRQPSFPHSAGNEDEETEQREVPESLDFCPLEEDTEQTEGGGLSADWPPTARVSSYMPQLGGYRPQ